MSVQNQPSILHICAAFHTYAINLQRVFLSLKTEKTLDHETYPEAGYLFLRLLGVGLQLLAQYVFKAYCKYNSLQQSRTGIFVYGRSCCLLLHTEKNFSSIGFRGKRFRENQCNGSDSKSSIVGSMFLEC